ncbi:unnamed protein product [Phytophthora fragariaefolia]|uniref:Unnamed protein product n=1 Tax=Phytophthora fragariaefolia TaxID=1490495 RepID=A0A9W6U6C4_9STRA|nr:unnamed protein product [Phytophthora fragariaefolia]
MPASSSGSRLSTLIRTCGYFCPISSVACRVCVNSDELRWLPSRFWNKATKDLSPVQVVENLKKLAQKTFPSLTDEQWDKQMTGYGGTDVDDHTRESWKYTCSRGMSGTPMYTLNGVPYEADADWTFDQWFKVIDPLVKANRPALDLTQMAWKDAHLSGVPRVQPDRDVMHLVRAGEWASSAQVCEGIAGGARACEYVPGRAMCCQKDEACILREGCVALQ